MEKRFVGFYNPSVILTYLALVSAFVSIYMSTQHNFKWAIFYIMVSGLFDMFDGTVARMIKRNDQEKAFGIQIDSLCDLVSFGVAPSMFAISLFEGEASQILGFTAGVLLTLCGVIRLAYFNVTEEERQKSTTQRRTVYSGLPITCSSIGAPVAYLIGLFLPGGTMPYFFSAFMIFVAFLFVFNFPVPKVHGKGNLVMIGLCLLLFVGVLLL